MSRKENREVEIRIALYLHRAMRSMGHVWGKKLAQNNLTPPKVVIRLALMLWF